MELGITAVLVVTFIVKGKKTQYSTAALFYWRVFRGTSGTIESTQVWSCGDWEWFTESHHSWLSLYPGSWRREVAGAEVVSQFPHSATLSMDSPLSTPGSGIYATQAQPGLCSDHWPAPETPSSVHPETKHRDVRQIHVQSINSGEWRNQQQQPDHLHSSQVY